VTLPGLLVVTDRRAARGDLVAQVARALAGVPALVQVREKDLSSRTLVALVRAIVDLGARVVVNDRVDVALAAGAHGVHLPENGFSVAEARRLLPPGTLVGASVHDVAGARARADADYLVLGPIWDTPGKTACGIEILAEATRAVTTPIFAIGGIDGPERARAARAAGAHGVAAIRAIVGSADPAAAARALLG
jgi:thiamine-phosphate pyrophosphorylase